MAKTSERRGGQRQLPTSLASLHFNLAGRYPTTLHVINTALNILASLSKCQNVYRGVSGGVLPESFVVPNEVDNFKGGVEYGFMSTTANKEVACEYAKGGSGMVRSGPSNSAARLSKTRLLELP